MHENDDNDKWIHKIHGTDYKISETYKIKKLLIKGYWSWN